MPSPTDREPIQPGSPEHTRIVSASKTPAILGVSPWMSPRALWHIMRGDVAADAVNGSNTEHLDMGHDLEPAIAAMWKRRNPTMRLSRGERQFSNPILPFPHIATPDRIASRGRGCKRIVELKSAREDDHWGEPGTDEIPTPYLVQVTFQMLVSGIREADVAVLLPYFDFRIYPITYSERLASVIVARCTNFHRSLSGANPPDIDDSDSTLKVLKKLHPDIDGTTAAVSPELGVEWLESGAALEAATARENFARSRMLAAAETARYIESNGVRVARRQPAARGAVALYRTKATPDDIASKGLS